MLGGTQEGPTQLWDWAWADSEEFCQNVMARDGGA